MAGGYDCGIWGWADGLQSLVPILALVSNVIVGANPPYSVTDFFTLYPKWGGKPLNPTATVDGTTATLTGVSSIAGLLAGQYVAGPGIASGSTIVSAVGTTVVLSKPTTLAGSPVQLMVYATPLAPTAVLNAYIYLASNSIFQARWCEMWQVAMGLFIDHYLTMWAMSQSSTPNATASQAAAAGLAFGIKTSKSAGDVSVGSTPIIFEGFGAWNLTVSGLELATLANVIGSGNMLFL